MLKHAFETSSRITKPASGSGAWLRVGSGDSPFLGRNLGIYSFSTHGDARNAFKLVGDILRAVDDFYEMREFEAQTAREEFFEKCATEMIKN